MFNDRLPWDHLPQYPADVRASEPDVSVWLPLARGQDSAGVSNWTPSTRASWTNGRHGVQTVFTGSEFTYAYDWAARADVSYECWLIVMGTTISSAGSAIFNNAASGSGLIASTTLLRLDVAASVRITQSVTVSPGDVLFVCGANANYKIYHRTSSGVVNLYTNTGAFGGARFTQAMQRTSQSLQFAARWTNREPSDDRIRELLNAPWDVFEPRKLVLPAYLASGAYTLTADSATFALSGNAAGLTVARALTADPQSYTLTGNAANTLRGFSLTADVASFSLTGNAAGLTAARLLTADQQTYALTGNDAGLIYTPAGAYTLTADVGTFTLTGNAAGLNYYKLTADTAAFALTGNDATLTYAPLNSYTLTAETGAFSLVGNAAGLTYAVASTVWDYEVEPGVTAAQAMRLILAAVSGKTSGIGTATEVYFAPDGVTPRITATFDGNGNRVAVELNGG